MKTLVERYGTTGFDSLDAMPADLRYYVSATAEEVAAFFDVRSEDLLRLLRARNGGKLRVSRERAADQAAVGVAQLPPHLWNGRAAPDHAGYLQETQWIEQYGGYGFDWETRHAWRRWRKGQTEGPPTIASTADPTNFPDALSALARYLVRSGLTREVAARRPGEFGELLEMAVVSLRLQSQSGPGSPAEDGPPEGLLALRETFAHLMDQNFGAALTEQDLIRMVDRSAIASEVLAGKLDAATAAEQLLATQYQQYLAAVRTARSSGAPAPWPYIETDKQLAVQRLAVRHIGHTLPRWEMKQLLKRSGGKIAVVEERLKARPKSELFTWTRQLMDQWLQRHEREQPLYTHEVTAVIQQTVAGRKLGQLSRHEVRWLKNDIKAVVRRQPEFRELYGDRFFTATPLEPMPHIMKPFGQPVSYQSGGIHTGFDVRGRRVDGKQPPLYAVDDGTVVHVGPLYCLRKGACRGPYAIVLDHGNNVYSVYSHNSQATVEPGERVTAGQMIGRQGNRGYSRGPHLHFEVHVGAPYTGNWTAPWRGGQFVDPLPWLPREWMEPVQEQNRAVADVAAK